jgi:hypothetical protein
MVKAIHFCESIDKCGKQIESLLIHHSSPNATDRWQMLHGQVLAPEKRAVRAGPLRVPPHRTFDEICGAKLCRPAGTGGICDDTPPRRRSRANVFERVSAEAVKCKGSVDCVPDRSNRWKITPLDAGSSGLIQRRLQASGIIRTSAGN